MVKLAAVIRFFTLFLFLSWTSYGQDAPSGGDDLSLQSPEGENLPSTSDKFTNSPSQNDTSNTMEGPSAIPSPSLPLSSETASTVATKATPKETVESLKKQMNAAQNRSEYDIAIDLANDLLKIQPNNLEVLKQKAFFLEHQKRNDELLEVYRTLTSKNPKDGDSFLKLATLEESLGNPSQALVDYQKAVSLDGNNAYANYRMGVILYNQGDWDPSEKSLKGALKIDAHQKGANYYLGLIYLQKEDLLSDQLSEEAGIFDDGDFLSTDPLRETREKNFVGENKNIAVRYFLNELSVNPTHIQANYELGKIYLKKGLFEEANRYLAKTVSLDTQNATAWKYLGISALHNKNYDHALRSLKKSLSLKPEQSDALTGMGIAYYQMANYPLAKVYLEQAIKAKTSFTPAYRALSKTLENLDSPIYEEKIIQNYRRLSKMDPKNTNYDLVLGNIAFRRKKMEDAIFYYGKVTARHPEKSDIWYLLGVAHYINQNYDKAIDAFQNALRGNPNDKRVWHQMGLSFYMKLDYASALNCLKRAVGLSPSVYMDMAIIYIKQDPDNMQKITDTLKSGVQKGLRVNVIADQLERLGIYHEEYLQSFR